MFYYVITIAAVLITFIAIVGLVGVLMACPSIMSGSSSTREKRTLQWVTYEEGSDEWSVLRRGCYIPRYRGSTPTAAALTSLAAPISVRDARKACRQLGLECELRDLSGQPVVAIDRRGTVRLIDERA